MCEKVIGDKAYSSFLVSGCYLQGNEVSSIPRIFSKVTRRERLNNKHNNQNKTCLDVPFRRSTMVLFRSLIYGHKNVSSLLVFSVGRTVG